jgi:hypothetical protein
MKLFSLGEIASVERITRQKFFPARTLSGQCPTIVGYCPRTLPIVERVLNVPAGTGINFSPAKKVNDTLLSLCPHIFDLKLFQTGDRGRSPKPVVFLTRILRTIDSRYDPEQIKSR